MGWCSGTEIFDQVAKFVLEADSTEQAKKDVLRVLIVALQDHDWDCETDSDYFGHPLVESVFRDLYPEWFEDEDASA